MRNNDVAKTNKVVTPLRFALQLETKVPGRKQTVITTCENGLKRKYSDDLSEALKQFLQDCIGAGIIVAVKIEAAGRFIIESLKPIAEYIEMIQNSLRSKFHTYTVVDCTPL